MAMEWVGNFRSLRQASKELEIPYHFLYGCYSLQHHSVSGSWFTITKIDPKGQILSPEVITNMEKSVRQRKEKLHERKKNTKKVKPVIQVTPAPVPSSTPVIIQNERESTTQSNPTSHRMDGNARYICDSASLWSLLPFSTPFTG